MSQIIRIKDVIKQSGLSRSSIYRLAAEGKFPAPIKLGEKSSGWLQSEVDGWIADRISERNQQRSA